MSTEPMPHQPPDPDALDSGAVFGLLRASVDPPGRPVDAVIARLREPDGAAWFVEALAHGPVGRRGEPATLLIRGAAALDDLHRMKGESKALLAPEHDEGTRWGGVLSYFLALAGALVHHGALPTGRDRAEVNEILVDLSAAVPAPWDEFLLRAAMVDG